MTAPTQDEVRAVVTPYDRGFAAALNGDAGPPIPLGDATWAERLYNRGWCDGREHRNAKDQANVD